MNTRHLAAGFAVCMIMLASPLSQASDIEKEKRWADQIIDALFDGEPVTLNADEQDFLAIYTGAADGGTANAAIVMHGIGVHPDWDQVVKPLRVGLAERGWSTLSLQMPILENGAAEEKYVPLMAEVPGRINAGLEYLKSQGATRIVIIGHSLGAAMAASYLAGSQDPAIIGFVGIGMNTSETLVELDSITSLKKITIPVFDLYGESDLAAVINSAPQRLEVITAQGNANSSQRKVDQADHFFNDMDTPLVGLVLSWMNDLP